MYRLVQGVLEPAGLSTPDRPEGLAGAVLPLSFRLVPGEGRPRIEVRQAAGDGRWLG